MNKPVDSWQGRPITVECSGVTVTRLGASLGAEISGVDLRKRFSDEAFNVILGQQVDPALCRERLLSSATLHGARDYSRWNG